MKDDTVNRAAAIDVMCELMRHWFGGDPKDEVREIKRELEKLPAVQLQQIVRCKDCKWFGDWGCSIRIVDDSDKPTENDFCSFAERRIDG